MAQTILKKLDIPTLNTVIVKNLRNPPVEAKKGKYVDLLLGEIDYAAVKQLVLNLKLEALQDICEYLEVDHGDNNPKNKMVLSKRVKESMTDEGIEQWLHSAPENVLQHIGTGLGLANVKKIGVRALKNVIQEELEIIGLRAIFGNLELALLKHICAQLDIANFEDVTNKNKLLEAICMGTEIPASQKKARKPTRKPKFAPIEECTTYDQLFQHYKLSDLEDWARAEGVKTSGPKKVLINRILAFLEGDTENTMSQAQTEKSEKAAKPAPKKAKEVKEPVRQSQRAAEKKAREEDDDEGSDMEEEEVVPAEKSKIEKPAQKAKAVPAEKPKATEKPKAAEKSKAAKKVVEPEPEPMEESESQADESAEPPSESMDVDLSEDASEAPTSLKGLIVVLTGTMAQSRKEIEAAISKAGGTVGKSVTKKTNYLVVADGTDRTTGKFQKAEEAGIKVVGESFLKNIL